MRLQDLKLQSTSTVRKYEWDTNKMLWELIMYNIFSIFFCVYRLLQNIKGFGAKKNFTDHQTRSKQCKIYGFSFSLQNAGLFAQDMKKCRVSFHSFPFKQCKRLGEMGTLDKNKPLQNGSKRFQHYVYLFKLYSILITLLLKTNLTNICWKLNKIGMYL